MLCDTYFSYFRDDFVPYFRFFIEKLWLFRGNVVPL